MHLAIAIVLGIVLAAFLIGVLNVVAGEHPGCGCLMFVGILAILVALLM